MRSCAFCGKSIEGRRPQAIFCCGRCRAAASHERAAQAAVSAKLLVGPLPVGETAQKDGNEPSAVDEYRLATPAEEARFERIKRDHADLARQGAMVPVATKRQAP